MLIKNFPITEKEYKFISEWLDSHFYYSIGITFFLKKTQDNHSEWKLLRLYDSKSSNILLGVAVLVANGTCFWLPKEENLEARKLCTAILNLNPARIMTTSFGRDLLYGSLDYPISLTKEYNQWAMINSKRFPETNGRMATISDIPLLIEYQYKYNEERSVEDTPDWEVLITQEKIAVYEFNGQIVSIVRFGLQTNRIVTLGGTYTFPCYRCRGFAVRVLEFAIDWIVSRGRIAYLIVDIDNLPAVNLYSKMGFKHIGIHYTGYLQYE